MTRQCFSGENGVEHDFKKPTALVPGENRAPPQGSDLCDPSWTFAARILGHIWAANQSCFVIRITNNSLCLLPGKSPQLRCLSINVENCGCFFMRKDNFFRGTDPGNLAWPDSRSRCRLQVVLVLLKLETY